jgi:hypothetical protein
MGLPELHELHSFYGNSVALDKSIQAATAFGEAFHGVDVLLSGAGILVDVSRTIFELNFDEVFTYFVGEDAGFSSEIAVGFHGPYLDPNVMRGHTWRQGLSSQVLDFATILCSKNNLRQLAMNGRKRLA